jgi:hypothetical protein
MADLHSDVQAMQDILYDILANGIDPERSEVSTQAVERFLFEHARSPKSRDEFRTFFAAHGLSASICAAPQPPPIRLPPIQRQSADVGMPAQLPVELASAPSAATVLQLTPPSLAATPRKPSLLGLWAGLALVGCVVLGAAWYGYSTISALQADLQREARHGRDDRMELKALRDHAAGLESSVAATGELVQRMDQKSDLLIQSLVPQPSSRSHGSR